VFSTPNFLFGVDYMGEKNTGYAIFMLPTEISISTDILGETYIDERQHLDFALVSSDTYGQEVLQNLQNLGFFDDVTKWIYEQNRVRNLPVITEGTVQMILPVSTGALVEANANVGRYQIQCRLTYYRS
jgi:peptidoglycan hydrolase-like protein with peptidoglycan-binding domain